jgi:hypothetical protein
MKVHNDGRTTFPGRCDGTDPGCTSDVRLTRFFDGDIDGSYVNHGYATRNSAIMLNPAGNGLSLSAGILDKTHEAQVGYFTTTQGFMESGEPECGTFDYPDNPQDKIGLVTYRLGDILPGRVKSVAFIYRRF